MEGIGDATDGMGFDVPMMMNQQPSFLGAYGQDTSPVPSVFPGATFQDDAGMGLGDDQNDAKRRRIARVGSAAGLGPREGEREKERQKG